MKPEPSDRGVRPLEEIGATFASRAVAAPRLSLRVLAGEMIAVNGRAVFLKNRKSQALLACLAVAEARSETRDRLISLLWSENDPARAHASFRQALYEVRIMLESAGFSGLRADKHRIWLDAESTEVDLADVLAETRAGRPHPLLIEHERLIETMLDKLESIDSEFGTWLAAKRAAIGRKLAYDLERALQQPGDAAQQAALAQALLNLDPTHEVAARVLMRERFRRGDTAGALKLYAGLWNLLAEEYDTEPSRETQALVAEIKLAEARVADPPAAPRRARRSSVPDRSVMPVEAGPSVPPPTVNAARTPLVITVGRFEAHGAKTSSYLLEGFRQELLARLVRFREWRVRDHQAGAGSEGEYVIEGSAMVHDGAARLVVTLRDARSGDYLWSERLPISVETWFATQQNVVQRVASRLNIYVSAQRLAALAQNRGEIAGAFDLWLRGQALLFSWSPENWHEARATLQKLVEDVPDFAPAYAALAPLNTTQHLFFPGILRDRERERIALSYAREATRLDPGDSRGQLCLGWAHAMTKQHDHAAAHHQMAYELNDSDPLILSSTALCAAFRGDAGLAEQRTRRLLDISPSLTAMQWGYRAEIEFLRGEYGECVRSAEQAESIVHIEGWRVAALAMISDRSEANKALQAFFSRAAAQWSGAEPASEEAMSRWFLHAFPIRRRGDWERLRQAFEAAGAPPVSLAHDDW